MSTNVTAKPRRKKVNPDEAFDPAAIVDLCNEAGEPTMAASLIREGVTVGEARARVDHTGKVRSVVALADKIAPRATVPVSYTEEAIRTRKPLAQVRAELLDRMAAADEALPVTTFHRAGTGGANHGGGDNSRQIARASMVKHLKDRGLKPKE